MCVGSEKVVGVGIRGGFVGLVRPNDMIAKVWMNYYKSTFFFDVVKKFLTFGKGSDIFVLCFQIHLFRNSSVG